MKAYFRFLSIKGLTCQFQEYYQSLIKCSLYQQRKRILRETSAIHLCHIVPCSEMYLFRININTSMKHNPLHFIPCDLYI